MDIQKAYQRAVTALELRKYNFAISQAKEILSHNPNIDYAYALLAQAYYGLSNYTEADTCIQKALQSNPTDVDYLCWYCGILNAQEKYQEALEISDEALTIEPTNTTVMYFRGLALHNMGKQERAEDVTKYLLKKDPNENCNHRLLANIYAEKMQLEDADFEFQKALELDPNNAATYNDYAVMKIDKEKNKEDEAIEMLQESLYLNPENKIVQDNLEYVRKKKFLVVKEIVILLCHIFLFSGYIYYIVRVKNVPISLIFISLLITTMWQYIENYLHSNKKSLSKPEN